MAQTDIRKLLNGILVAGLLVGLIWIVQFVFWLTMADTYPWGVHPRELSRLWGVLTGPFVHANFHHLIANSGPLFFFTAAVFYFYRPVAWRVMIWTIFMTDAWVWVAAHEGSHIGASGLVYGLGAFLFFSGVFRRDIRSMLLALTIAFFYGGMVWGVLPAQVGISWESHLFGALAGIVLAFYFKKHTPVERKRYEWENEPDVTQDDSEALWNYRKSWPGAGHEYTPENHEENEGEFPIEED